MGGEKQHKFLFRAGASTGECTGGALHVGAPPKFVRTIFVSITGFAALTIASQASAQNAIEPPGVQPVEMIATPKTLATQLKQTGAQTPVEQTDSVAKLTVASGMGAAQVTIATALAGAQVVASRDSDIVGRPIDIFRPIGTGGGSSVSFPSRMPVAAQAITSGFGLRVHPILGGLREHSGVDLAAPYGSPVVATTDGVVGEANWRGGYGLFVALDNGNLETRYGHMSRLNVASGQRVHKGDVIGYVGSTGLSTGPHLHYEVRVNGQAVDPLRNRSR